MCDTRRRGLGEMSSAASEGVLGARQGSDRVASVLYFSLGIVGSTSRLSIAMGRMGTGGDEGRERPSRDVIPSYMQRGLATSPGIGSW